MIQKFWNDFVQESGKNAALKGTICFGESLEAANAAAEASACGKKTLMTYVNTVKITESDRSLFIDIQIFKSADYLHDYLSQRTLTGVSSPLFISPMPRKNPFE